MPTSTMPEALTESYCERCGTRYEFAAPAKMTPTRRARGLMAGFKNYVMSQDSLSDSLGDAMRQQEEALASKQLDAFHDSFNFCIDCRQYTCVNCWNDDAGPLPELPAAAGRDAAGRSGSPRRSATCAARATPCSSRSTQAAWPALDLNEPRPGPAGRSSHLRPPWRRPRRRARLGPPSRSPCWSRPSEPEPIVGRAVGARAGADVLVEAEAEPEPVVAGADRMPEPGRCREAEPMRSSPEPSRSRSWPSRSRVGEPEPEPVLVEAEAEPEPVVGARARAGAGRGRSRAGADAGRPEPEPEPVEAEPSPRQCRSRRRCRIARCARSAKPSSTSRNAAGKDEVPAAAAAAVGRRRGRRSPLAARSSTCLGWAIPGRGPVGRSKRSSPTGRAAQPPRQAEPGVRLRCRRRRVLGCLGPRGRRRHQPGRRPDLRRMRAVALAHRRASAAAAARRRPSRPSRSRSTPFAASLPLGRRSEPLRRGRCIGRRRARRSSRVDADVVPWLPPPTLPDERRA